MHAEQRDPKYLTNTRDLVIYLGATAYFMDELTFLRTRIEAWRRDPEVTLATLEQLHREEEAMKTRLTEVEEEAEGMIALRAQYRADNWNQPDERPWEPIVDPDWRPPRRRYAR